MASPFSPHTKHRSLVADSVIFARVAQYPAPSAETGHRRDGTILAMMGGSTPIRFLTETAQGSRMPTLTVTASTDYRSMPNSNLVTGQNITDIVFAAPGAGGNVIATFFNTQFGGGSISDTVVLTGGDDYDRIDIFFVGMAANFSVAGWTLVNWTLNDSIHFSGTSEGDTITGSAGIENISGQNGADSLSGGNGDDLLYGGSGADTLRGDAGDDTLSGDADNDLLDGGTGSDMIVFFSSAPVFVDLVQGIATGEGTDTLLNFENVQTGNGSDTIFGNNGANLILAGDGNNQLFGLGGNDFFNSFSGNDVLDGGTGVDTMYGGSGDDSYIVDDFLDTIVEFASGGYDTVFATANYTLSSYIEQLVLRGAATAGTGNGTSNYLYGGESAFSLMLDGGFGDDILYAGLAGHNTLLGGYDNDILLVYGGNNYVEGGPGNDIYYTYTATDTLVEFGNGGVDTIFANWNITMGANFEQLVLFGSASVAVGSADNNIIYGNSTTGAVNLFGLGGADVLYGGAGFDTLSGGAGNDQLFGLGGVNTLYGGADNDIYYFAGGMGNIIELANEGFDTIYIDVAFQMPDNTEQLIQYGSGDIIGNASDNAINAVAATAGVSINGAGGNDYLYNSSFSDTLEGGTGSDQLDLRGALAGNDVIRYGANGAMGNDTIYGFDADPADGQDVISLTGRGYAAGSIGASITIAAAGSHTLVSFTSGALAGSSLLLFNVSSATVTSADFVF
jgi:Ca2+-binding RTX toxin-like protein